MSLDVLPFLCLPSASSPSLPWGVTNGRCRLDDSLPRSIKSSTCRVASSSQISLLALMDEAQRIVPLCFFLAGVWPDFSLGRDSLLFGETPRKSQKRFATRASLASMREDWVACAMFISPLVTSWWTRSGDRGGEFKLAMVVLWFFFVGHKFCLCQSIAERREK